MTTPGVQAWAESMVLHMLTIYDRHGWFYADADISSAAKRHGVRMGLPSDVLEAPLRTAFDLMRTDASTPDRSDDDWARDFAERLRPDRQIGPEWMTQLISSHARLRSFRSTRTLAGLREMLHMATVA